MEGTGYLGEERISSLLLKMSTQTTMAILLYSIYSITDTYFVSRGVGEYAAGGVSIAAPILTMLGAVSTTVGAGGASIVSRLLGKGDRKMAAAVTANAMLVFWLFAIANTILGLLFLEPVLYLLGTTESLMVYTKGYAKIILLGAITSTGFSAIIRAEGDTKFSLYMWIVPVTVNLVLDPLLIMELGYGVEGAAIATVCAQSISMFMSIYFFFFKKRVTYKIHLYDFKFRFNLVKEIILIGFPSFVLQMSTSISAVLVNNILKVQGGDMAISAYGIVVKIQTFLIMPQNGIVQGMQPIVGYNYGMGHKQRVNETIKLAIKAMLLYSVIIAVAGILCRNILIGIFILDEQILLLAFSIFNFMMITLPIKGIPTLVSSYYQSVGKAKISLAIPIVNMIVIQIPVLYIMSSIWGMNGIWSSFIISDSLGLVFALYYYFKKGVR